MRHYTAAVHTVTTVDLKRDCAAVQIPSGQTSTLPAGTTVDITQTLGGTYTVRALTGGLFRIATEDADALGITETVAMPQSGTGDPVPVDEQRIWDILRTCYDPEIPVNIVDLGLVYDMHLEDLATGGKSVQVKMTLTAPGCGMGGVIAGDAQQKLLTLEGIEEAVVEIVWEPAWHQSMITAAGRRVLGLE